MTPHAQTDSDALQIGRAAARADLRKTGHVRAALTIAVLALLIAGTGCRSVWIEVANETAETVTVTTFLEEDPYGPSTYEVEPGGSVSISVGTLEQRWEISDQDGIVLIEAIVSSGNADFYDRRIVVR